MTSTETWHALTTAPGWERRVVDALHEKGFAPYLPQTTQTTIRRGQKRIRQALVIPSYVFVQLEVWSTKWSEIRRKDRFEQRSRPVVRGKVIVGHKIAEGHSAVKKPALAGIEGVGSLIRNGDRPSPIPPDQMARVMACSDDYERILEWLMKAGKVVRVSTRSMRRAAKQRYRLAKRTA